MKIAVIGAAGMVGKELVSEANARGHEVIGYTRGGAGNTQTLSIDDTAAVVNAINNADVTVISVASRDDYQAAIDAHRNLIEKKPAGRVLVVGGAGALEVDGTRLVDLPTFPAEYKPEALAFAQVLAEYRSAADIDWTMIAPSPEIAPGTRTGEYVTALDTPAGNFVSAQDFAVAALDEIENPQHRGTRFTVASANEATARA